MQGLDLYSSTAVLLESCTTAVVVQLVQLPLHTGDKHLKKAINSKRWRMFQGEGFVFCVSRKELKENVAGVAGRARR